MSDAPQVAGALPTSVPLSPDAASLGGVVPILGRRGEAWARAGVAADTGRPGSASALSSV